MYILQNSFKNIFRNAGRNLIIGIIIITMLTLTGITMIINVTTDNIIKDYKEQFGSEIYIRYDETKIKQGNKTINGTAKYYEPPIITKETKLSLANSNYLKESFIEAIYPAYAKDLKGLDQGKNGYGGNIQQRSSENQEYYDVNVQIIGYNDIKFLEDFKNHTRKLTSGKMFKNKNEAIISEDFAKLNKLKIGDKIKIYNPEKSLNLEPIELTITGIYYDSTESKYGNIVSAATNPRNEILTSYDTLKNYEKKVNNDIYSLSIKYFLKNPNLLKSFNKEAHSKGLHKHYYMATDEASYDKIVKPAESLASVSTKFLISVLVVGTAVLILLSILSIRERKYEIGVLRAMGMKKNKVVRGLIYESLIMVVFSLIIGLTIASISSQPISNNFTKSINEQSATDIWGNKEQISEIKVIFTKEAAFKVSIIAVSLALVSSSIGVLYILRYEPMKILSERN